VAREEALRQRILELLMPEGQPIGEGGHRRGEIRVVEGSLTDALELFEELEELGKRAYAPNYPGELAVLGAEGKVGFRRKSKSGEPTIDVGLQCVPRIRKIKFVQGASR
jgi:hypothetical protein